jgi:N-acetylmuramoyl-L-alanine amidase
MSGYAQCQTLMIGEQMTDEKRTLFILDPGHGIDIKGKRSPEIPPGFCEWKFVREIADEIILRYDNRKWQVKSVLDYQENKELSMKLKMRCWHANHLAFNFERAVSAQYNKPRVYFVSIHTNAAGNNGWYDVHGCKGFISVHSSDKSKVIAEKLTDNLSAVAGIRNNGTARKNFYVLKHTICPAVLIETLFHTSKKDCEIAINDKDKIIDAFIKTFDEIAEMG